MFTGKYPHEHQSNRFGDSVDTPLVTDLSDRGYTTYGVSANGFASQRTGFHEEFDEFRYTGGRDPYVDGMDVSGTAQRILRESNGTYREALLEVLRQIPRHDRPAKSLVNLAAVGCGELTNKFEFLQHIRHPAFAPTSDYSYKPENNTSVIRSMLQSHDSNEPFFLFTNYMDTHRCYKPDPELQEKHIGRTLDYNELIRLNEEVAAPWAFESKKAQNELDEEDIETLRGLYAGEVEAADQHLKKIYEILDKQGMLENTLLVVTADHGENLGETDEIGRQRMGHEASVSDAVLRVPLIVVNPKLDPSTVDDEVSLDFFYNLFVSVADSGTQLQKTIQEIVPDKPAVSQYPATGGGDETRKKYPDAPEEAICHRSSEHSVCAYNNGWKVVMESTSKKWVESTDGVVSVTDAPDSLIQIVNQHISELQRMDEAGDLSNEDVAQLEALGYI